MTAIFIPGPLLQANSTSHGLGVQFFAGYFFYEGNNRDEGFLPALGLCYRYQNDPWQLGFQVDYGEGNTAFEGESLLPSTEDESKQRLLSWEAYFNYQVHEEKLWTLSLGASLGFFSWQREVALSYNENYHWRHLGFSLEGTFQVEEDWRIFISPRLLLFFDGDIKTKLYVANPSYNTPEGDLKNFGLGYALETGFVTEETQGSWGMTAFFRLYQLERKSDLLFTYENNPLFLEKKHAIRVFQAGLKVFYLFHL